MSNKLLTICGRGALCVLLSLLFLIAAHAQTTDDAGKNEFSVWGGYSPDSSTAIQGSGRQEDARFGLVAVRYARRFNNNDTVNLKYTLDAIPAAVLSEKTFRFVPVGTSFRIEEDRRTSYGFGVAPLGLQLNFRPRKKLQPFVAGSGGLLYFNKTLQDGFGKKLNFTADVGGGIEYRLKNERAVTFGYKYFHISNGGRGLVNPGIDNNLFYVGYSFFK